jgi:AraC-like DNA-binding protein
MKIELINIIHTLIIWQCVLFSIILLTPKYNKRRENKFLALLLITLGFHFSYNILLTNQIFIEILPQYSCSYGFLYGPLLYLYVKYRFRKDLVFKPIYFLHFLPFTLIILFTLLGYGLCNIAMVLVLPMMLIYCLFSFFEIKEYKKIMLQVSTTINYAEIKWIKSLLVVQLIIIILNFIQLQFNEEILEVIVQFGLLILVNIIIYQGLKNPHFFQKLSKEDGLLFEIKKTKEPLNIDVLNSISIILEKHMKIEKPYLNPELKLNTLAKELDVHPKILSQTLNQILGSNFSEYINSFRIKQAKFLLKNSNDKSITIMEIMYQVGFNSRSVFNTTFKNITGVTPSRYRDNN